MEPFVDEIREELEGFEVGEEVQLFTLDASPFGGGVYAFSPSPVEAADGSQVQPTFGGQSYTVLPFESEGWEYSAGGPLPRPVVRFKIAREDGDSLTAASFLLGILSSLDDLLGARVTRVRTLRRFLDDGDTPDPQAHFGVEIYKVGQKTNQTGSLVELQLRSDLDLEDVMLPARQVLNHCQSRYRRPQADGSFDYSEATCPYVGESCFDLQGNPVADPRDDRCARRLSDCRLRFGQNAKLPYGGFPGAGKLQRYS